MRVKAQQFGYVIAMLLGGVLRLNINLSDKIILSFFFVTMSLILLYSENFFPSEKEEESHG